MNEICTDLIFRGFNPKKHKKIRTVGSVLNEIPESSQPVGVEITVKLHV